jgi:hypothetical protein
MKKIVQTLTLLKTAAGGVGQQRPLEERYGATEG